MEFLAFLASLRFGYLGRAAGARNSQCHPLSHEAGAQGAAFGEQRLDPVVVAVFEQRRQRAELGPGADTAGSSRWGHGRSCVGVQIRTSKFP